MIEATQNVLWLRNLQTPTVRAGVFNSAFISTEPGTPKNVRELPVRFWFEKEYEGNRKLHVVLTDAFFEIDDDRRSDILVFINKIGVATNDKIAWEMNITTENSQKLLR